MAFVSNTKTVGSICSGIEAASVAWTQFGCKFLWFSEIADFPSRLLHEKYPNITNHGDMNLFPSLITEKRIDAPDVICGGTPCQAFSLAGWKKGLNDDRGNLTLKFVDIINANDNRRLSEGKNRTIVFWENVEGVLSDKTNAFGCLVSSLAGLSELISVEKWPTSGLIRGPERNVAWRVLDAKYFGIPQQRKRLYVMAGGKDFNPETILFEKHCNSNYTEEYPKSSLKFEKDGHSFELFREYTDCLYSAYGTKWNGNAAATNGSLFVAQDNRLRRLSPIECERLMGFPDNYTNLDKAKKTNRYQATGNSWAIPVISWIGKRLFGKEECLEPLEEKHFLFSGCLNQTQDYSFFQFGKDICIADDGTEINATYYPEYPCFASLSDIISPDAPEDIYISPVGCYGILRRKIERKMPINKRLEEILIAISSQMDSKEIEKKSRIQHRGRLSQEDDSAIQKELF